MKGLQDNLNPGVTEAQAVEMLSQHLITQPVFDALFAGHAFSDHNPVSQVMQSMVDALEQQNLTTEPATSPGSTPACNGPLRESPTPPAVQTIIKRLYEKFFTGAFRDTSERLGIVYTPNEIVDFILRSADRLSRDHFGAGLTDQGVHVLDPFTGTVPSSSGSSSQASSRPRRPGAQIPTRAPRERDSAAGLLRRRSEHRSHLQRSSGRRIRRVPGVVLTDTFQSAEDDDTYDDPRRVRRQQRTRQAAERSRHSRHRRQPALLVRAKTRPMTTTRTSSIRTSTIESPNTYAARSAATLKNSLYDSYIRAIRWASDRIKDRGIVAYVTNGGFLDGNTAAGLRLTLQDEFTELYILNLRGNQRTAVRNPDAKAEGVRLGQPRIRRRVAASENPERLSSGTIHYRDIGDYLSRDDKLSLLELYRDSDGVPWKPITRMSTATGSTNATTRSRPLLRSEIASLLSRQSSAPSLGA